MTTAHHTGGVREWIVDDPLIGRRCCYYAVCSCGYRGDPHYVRDVAEEDATVHINENEEEPATMTGQELYETWRSVHASDCDPWNALDQSDRDAWDRLSIEIALAEREKARGEKAE